MAPYERSRKTCMFYVKGRCNKGSSCMFLHANIESQSHNDIECEKPKEAVKPNPHQCKFFAKGKCKRGDTCTFKHSLSKADEDEKIKTFTPTPSSPATRRSIPDKSTATTTAAAAPCKTIDPTIKARAAATFASTSATSVDAISRRGMIWFSPRAKASALAEAAAKAEEEVVVAAAALGPSTLAIAEEGKEQVQHHSAPPKRSTRSSSKRAVDGSIAVELDGETGGKEVRKGTRGREGKQSSGEIIAGSENGPAQGGKVGRRHWEKVALGEGRGVMVGVGAVDREKIHDGKCAGEGRGGAGGELEEKELSAAKAGETDKANTKLCREARLTKKVRAVKTEVKERVESKGNKRKAGAAKGVPKGEKTAGAELETNQRTFTGASEAVARAKMNSKNENAVDVSMTKSEDKEAVEGGTWLAAATRKILPAESSVASIGGSFFRYGHPPHAHSLSVSLAHLFFGNGCMGSVYFTPYKNWNTSFCRSQL
ncbi:unnamed protein product [Choristocarpus tenellus]